MTGHRQTVDERARIASLERMLPDGTSALEIGARNGYITSILATRYSEVVALDLVRPRLNVPNVKCVAGDVRELQLETAAFDVVLCSEVLEHIPPRDLAKACSELARVVSRHLLIGVPFEQDLRVARTRCSRCGSINPPYGHVNRFDRTRLESLFRPLEATSIETVGSTRERTNSLSDVMMRMAGYPWGTYGQDEPCIACLEAIGPAPKSSICGKALCASASKIDLLLRALHRPRAKWIHMLFSRDRSNPALIHADPGTYQ